jgi:hypothetical protein
MNTKQLLLGTLLGGVSFFFLGWLIFGILLSPIMEANCSNISRPMEEMLFGPLIVSNLLWGLLISLNMAWTQKTGALAGLKTATLLGLIITSAMDLSLYSMTTYFNNLNAVIFDVFGNVLLYAITGTLLGLTLFKTPKESA